MRHTLLIVCLLLRAKAQLTFEQPPPGGATKTIAEDAKSGTSLYGLQATDPRGNTPSFSIASSRCESTPQPSSIPTFTINSLDQLVVPEDRLDAESCTKFRFTFIATAGGSTVTSGPLTVNVTDVNDNPPQFIRPLFHGDVWKNDKAGKIVNENNTISAIDPDISNKSITLTISGAQRTFAITDNGSVYVYGTSGLEVLASPTVLTIQASDGGLTSTANLEIIVHVDPCSSSPCQNDGSCSSLKDHFNCSCLSGYLGTHCENVNYCVVNLCGNGNCTSEASGYKCKCSGFSIPITNCSRELTCLQKSLTIDETNKTTAFAVNPFDDGSNMYLPDNFDRNVSFINDSSTYTFNATHLILWNGTDREMFSTLKFHFHITMDGVSIQCPMTIIVNDINDHAPVFDSTSYTSCALTGIKTDTTLLEVHATDNDATPAFNTLSYNLTGSGNFKIDSKSGVIKTSTSLNQSGVFNLSINANDGKHEGTATLHILVYDGNCSSNATFVSCQIPDKSGCNCVSSSNTICTNIFTTSNPTAESTKLTTVKPSTNFTEPLSTTSTKPASVDVTTVNVDMNTTVDVKDDDTSRDGITNMIIGLSVAGFCAIVILLAIICLFVHYKKLTPELKYMQGPGNKKENSWLEKDSLTYQQSVFCDGPSQRSTNHHHHQTSIL